jgi:hypothetical protein
MPNVTANGIQIEYDTWIREIITVKTSAKTA